MTIDPALLIAWHSRTGASEQLASAAKDGAGDRAILKYAADVTCEDMLGAAGYLFVCPENLATMSGLMKEMFDCHYYPLLGKIEGRAYATIIAAGSDGQGATRQIDRIAAGWRLRRVRKQVIINFNAQDAESIQKHKSVEDSDLIQCNELGEGFSEALALGIW